MAIHTLESLSEHEGKGLADLAAAYGRAAEDAAMQFLEGVAQISGALNKLAALPGATDLARRLLLDLNLLPKEVQGVQG